MTRWIGLLLAWTLALGGVARAHVLAFSHIDLHLQPSQTLVVARIPIIALTQQTPPLSLAGATEQTLRTNPLPAPVGVSLAGLVAERLRLKDGGKALPLAIGAIAPAGDDIAVTATAGPVHGALDVSANLFPDDSLHKVFVNVYRGPELAGQYALDRQAPAFTLDAPERPLAEVIFTFIREGVHHIFIGPDHILFVIALVLLGGSLWSQIKIISAFTVAHSITLALATFNILHPPSRIVESTIALSIVAVGLHDLRQLRLGLPPRKGLDLRIVFAFCFGLVHGFGFANALAEMELPRQALAWSLAAFNIGVEIGQICILLIAAPVIAALGRYTPPRVARDVLSAAACVVVLVGGFWFCQRAFGA